MPSQYHPLFFGQNSIECVSLEPSCHLSPAPPPGASRKRPLVGAPNSMKYCLAN